MRIAMNLKVSLFLIFSNSLTKHATNNYQNGSNNDPQTVRNEPWVTPEAQKRRTGEPLSPEMWKAGQAGCQMESQRALGFFGVMVFGGLLGPLGAPGAPLGLPGEPFEGFGVQHFSKSCNVFQSLLPHTLPGGPKV